jgi:hypothetical protein
MLCLLVTAIGVGADLFLGQVMFGLAGIHLGFHDILVADVAHFQLVTTREGNEFPFQTAFRDPALGDLGGNLTGCGVVDARGGNFRAVIPDACEFAFSRNTSRAMSAASL